MTTGERIKALRTELGWSQRDLAVRLGYKDHTTLARIETGKVDLPQSRLKKIADVLGVTSGYLVGEYRSPEELGALAAEVARDPDLQSLVDNYLRLSPADRETVGRLVASMAANKKD